MTIVLCNERLPEVDVYVEAEIIDGELKISGQDMGPLCEEIFGDREYEYFYTFDKENTNKLFTFLSKDSDNARYGLLTEHFSGLDGCEILREYCEKREIQYSFHTC